MKGMALEVLFIIIIISIVDYYIFVVVTMIKLRN